MNEGYKNEGIDVLEKEGELSAEKVEASLELEKIITEIPNLDSEKGVKNIEKNPEIKKKMIKAVKILGALAVAVIAVGTLEDNGAATEFIEAFNHVFITTGAIGYAAIESAKK